MTGIISSLNFGLEWQVADACDVNRKKKGKQILFFPSSQIQKQKTKDKRNKTFNIPTAFQTKEYHSALHTGRAFFKQSWISSYRLWKNNQ